MPSYRRGYSRGYRAYRGYRRYRRYRRYYRRYGGYARKFANGSSRSTIRVKVPMNYVANIGGVGNDGTAGVEIAKAFEGTVTTANKKSVMNSPLYLLYTQLYEEVKCIGIKARIAINTPIGSVSVPALQMITGWDRRSGDGEAPPTWAELNTYSTQQSVTAINNSVAKLTRSCYASDLMEKAQWHDCTLTIPSAGQVRDAAVVAAGRNPNFFNPSLFIAFRIPEATAAQTISYTIEIMYYFAFRNPKYGAAPTASAKSVEMRAAMIEDDPLDTEEIMDEGTLDEVPVRTKTNPLSVDGVHKSVRTLVGAETTRMRAEARRKQARETVRDM